MSGMTHEERLLALRHLYPAARWPEDITLSDDGTGSRVTHWGLPGEQPTEAQLVTALPAARVRDAARRDLRECQSLLDERYRLFTRARATGNVADALDVQAEIQELLTYMEELRDAPDPA